MPSQSMEHRGKNHWMFESMRAMWYAVNGHADLITSDVLCALNYRQVQLKAEAEHQVPRVPGPGEIGHFAAFARPTWDPHSESTTEERTHYQLDGLAHVFCRRRLSGPSLMDAAKAMPEDRGEDRVAAASLSWVQLHSLNSDGGQGRGYSVEGTPAARMTRRVRTTAGDE